MNSSYISEYFFRARDIVDKFNPEHTVVLQFFQKKDVAIVAGMQEVLELLKSKLSTTQTIIRYLPEGSLVTAREVVLELEGKYQDFGIYEGIIDGILARSTSIATNSYKCIRAAKNKEVVCMSDRSDHYCNQMRDGQAMFVGGIKSFSSKAQSPSEDCKIYGSIPHAVIQNFKGDLVSVMKHYSTLFPEEELIALVDFHNDVISDSLNVLREFGKKLFGVRVDTSAGVKDRMFSQEENEFGVTVNQIKRLREALDREGGSHVKICVSSGFTPEKIKIFEEQGAPVDVYGVGEYLLQIENTFCADCVKLNGEDCAKQGREYRHNPRLVVFKWE